MAERPPRRVRWLLHATLIGLGVLAMAGAALWLLLPAIAGRIVVDRLAAMGVPSPQLAVVRVGYGRAAAVDLALGDGEELTAQEVVVDYSFPDVLDGKVDAVTIRSPSLRVSVGPDGISLGSLDALLRGGGGGMPSIPPVAIEDATVALATGLGTVTLTGSGTVTEAAGAIAIDLDIAATAAQGSAEGALSVKLAGSDADARLALTGGRIALPDLLSTTATGEVTAKLAAGDVAALDGRLAIAGLRLSDPRAAALGTLAGTVVLDRAPEAWRAAVTLSDAAKSLDLDLRLATSEPGLENQVTVAADLDATAAAPLWSLAGLPQPSAGSMSGQAVANLIPARLLEAAGSGRMPELAGSIALDLRDLAFEDSVNTVSAAAGADVETDADGTIRFTTAAPILAEMAIDRTMLGASGLPSEIVELLAQPLAASVELTGPVELRHDGDRMSVSGAPAVSIDLPDGRRLADARGTVTIGTGAQGLAFALSPLDARIDLPGGTALPPAALTLTGSASGEGSGGRAELALIADAPEIEAGGVRAKQVKLDLPLILELAEGRLVARLADDAAVSVDRLTGTAPLRIVGPVQLAFIPGDVPFLAMTFDDPEGPRAALDLKTAPIRLAGSVEAEHGSFESDLSLPQLRVRGELGGGRWSGNLSAADGKLAVPTYQMEASDLDVSAELPAEGPARLSVTGALAHRAERALVIPLSASLTARQAKNGWTFKGHAADAFDRLSIDVEGRHDLTRNRGSGKLRVAPIEFAPNVRQPQDLAPFLAGVAEDVSGTIALAGDLSWNANGVVSDLELLLRDVSATTAAATIDRLNGVIAVDGLSPFSTPPGQRVAVAAIDAGLPLTDGLLTFRVAPGRRLEIADGQLHLAGGTVHMEPAVYDPEAGSNPAVLAVSGVDLGQLLALAQVDGLTGTGKLSGRIPVRLVPGDLVIEDGELEAEAPGTLSYAPLAPPAALQGQGETVSLAMSALTNFQYQQLRLRVDRQAGGEMVVGMHIRGNNPDFYDGYPVELNLNVSGALDRVLRQSLAGYRIPETIEQQLKEFAQ